MRLSAAFASLALLAGCATSPGADRLAEKDPLEGVNRGVWQFNMAADKALIKPTTMVYRTVTPRPARRGLSRLLANLSEPFSAINNLLQGKPDRAGRNIERFVINTTIGVGGLADHATGFGVAPAEEDFGQTLATWGVNGGPYLVLPLLGPSTLRDGVGSGVGMLTNPYRVGLREADLSTAERLSLMAGEVVVLRSDMIESGADAFLETSLDPYAAARSAYLQRRSVQIANSENDPVADEVAEEALEEGMGEPPADSTPIAPPAGENGN